MTKNISYEEIENTIYDATALIEENQREGRIDPTKPHPDYLQGLGLLQNLDGNPDTNRLKEIKSEANDLLSKHSQLGQGRREAILTQNEPNP